MYRSKFLLTLKRILENEAGCMTKTTPQKGEGFVPYNRHNIKWGQVDTNNANYIRLVFDLKQESFSEKIFAEKTGLSITPPKKIVTGYRFKVSEKLNHHDQLFVFLENNFLEYNKAGVQAILAYAKEWVAESGFKAQPSR